MIDFAELAGALTRCVPLLAVLAGASVGLWLADRVLRRQLRHVEAGGFTRQIVMLALTARPSRS